MAALRRLRSSPSRKYRPFVENLPNRSIRPKGDLQVPVDERLENAPKRPMRSAEVPSGIAATSPSPRRPASSSDRRTRRQCHRGEGEEEVAAAGGLDPV